MRRHNALLPLHDGLVEMARHQYKKEECNRYRPGNLRTVGENERHPGNENQRFDMTTPPSTCVTVC